MAGENLTSGIERIKLDPTKIVGAPGLKAWAGRISEEWDPALRGSKAAKLYREMKDSEPVLATVLRMITTVLQQADVYVQPHKSGTPLAKEAQELVEDCIEDMSPTWDEFLEEALSAVAYGWSYHEITYKRRADGRLGWASIDIRGQDSLDRWEIDDAGRVVGLWQMPPPSYRRVFIPIEKALHFRLGGEKGNPEGKSLFRASKRPYLYKRSLEEIEAIGIERDLAGLPVLEVPLDLLGADASPEDRAFVDGLFSRVKNVRRDAEEAMVLPASEYSTPSGDQVKTGWKFSLLTSGGSRQVNAGEVIRRYEHRMLMTFLAEFLLLGEAGGGGSYALAKDKSDFLVLSLTAILKGIVRTFTQQAIAPLMELNGYPEDAWPTLEHDDIESPALGELATYVSTLVQSGVLMPDEALERKLREWAALPQLGEDDPLSGAPQEIEPRSAPTFDDGAERPQAPAQAPQGEREGEDIQSTALNGAQVTSAKEIVIDVAAGRLPRESGVAMLQRFFQISQGDAEAIMGSVARGFVPADTEDDSGSRPPA